MREVAEYMRVGLQISTKKVVLKVLGESEGESRWVTPKNLTAKVTETR